MEYQDYVMKQQAKYILKLEEDNRNLRSLNKGLLEINSILKKQVANLKHIIKVKDRLIDLLKASIKRNINKQILITLGSNTLPFLYTGAREKKK